MASQYPAKKNAAFTLFFTLYKNDGTVVANPGTITKKVSIDGAAVADIAASVTEEDTTYGQCSVVLSAAEMNGDAIWIYITDNTAGTVPFTATIYTTANTLDERAAQLGVVASGTAQSATGTTIVLAAASAFANDELNGAVVVITGGTGIGQSRIITGYVSSTDTATVDTWTTTPSGTITYVILAAPPASATALPSVSVDAATLRAAVGLASANLDTQLTALPTDADVNAACDTAIGDAALATATTLATVDAVVDAIKAKTDNLPLIPAASGDAVTLTSAAIDAILDEVVEGSTTLRQLLRGFGAILLSKSAGNGTATLTFRDVADSKNRVVATMDDDRNRTAITLDLT